MRTAGQGQAAAPWERDEPPKVQGPAWAPILGRGRISPGLSRMWSAINSLPCFGGGGYACCGRSSVERLFFVVRRYACREEMRT